jgi:succinyl-CoA synthetase beta subunit
VDLLEFQGKSLLARAGVPVPEGRVARTASEAGEVAATLGGRVVVKAQVPVGGRGKAGGIVVVGGPDEARDAAAAILGMEIKGHPVRLVLVERAVPVSDQYYLALTLDRTSQQHLVMVSARGGVDIEEAASRDSAAVVRMLIDPVFGFAPWQAREVAYRAGLRAEAIPGATEVLLALYRAFVGFDCDLVEVNPLVRSVEGGVLALDAKVILDGAAFFRHPDFAAFRDDLAEDPLERMARERGLGTFVHLDGSVGIMANGAGMAMATLDMVSLVGGAPANFLDIGGGVGEEVIAGALELLAQDAGVKAGLVNIFGGITHCDVVARGIAAAVERRDLPWPLVVRLDGTNASEGRAILSGLSSAKVVPAAGMLEAARRAVELAGRV